jgi:glycosyltransferase involved in cell wall biosynthesis
VNIAIVTETFPPEVNGVAMTFGLIARELSRRGHRVTVYRPHRRDLSAPAPSADYNEVAMPGMPIPGYPLLRLGLPARGRLLRQWRRARPDLVHVVTEGPLGASAITAAHQLGLPVTSSFHTNFHAYTGNYGFAPLRRVVLAWLRHVHNRTRLTFAPTHELCDELAALGFRNLAVLSRGVDSVPLGEQTTQRPSCCTSAAWPRRKTTNWSSAPSTKCGRPIPVAGLSSPARAR